MKAIAVVCVMVMCFGAGPTTNPVTQPSSNIPRIMAELRGQNAALTALVKDLERQIAALRDENAKLKRAASATTQPDLAAEIESAIKAHRLVVGMTLAEARLSMEEDGEIVAEKDDVRRYHWLHNGEFYADVAQGKITRWGTTPTQSQPPRGTFNPNAIPGLGPARR